MKRHIALVALLTAVISACSSRPRDERPKTPFDFTNWYQDCWNHFNQKQWDAFTNCYDVNATSQQLGYGQPTVTGASAVVKASQDFVKTFPDVRGEPQLIMINGNHIAGMYLLKGTNTGPILGPDGKDITPTKNKIGMFFGHSVEFDPRTSKVVRELGVMDGITLENQLGLLKIAGRPVIDTGTEKPTVLIGTNNETEANHLQIKKEQLEAWNRHDAEANDKFFADDYTLHDMTQPMDLQKAEASAMNKALWKRFSNANLNGSWWAASDFIVFTGTLEGTNDGDYPPLKKTGKKVSILMLDFIRFADKKIRAEWVLFDNAGVVSQLMK